MLFLILLLLKTRYFVKTLLSNKNFLLIGRMCRLIIILPIPVILALGKFPNVVKLYIYIKVIDREIIRARVTHTQKGSPAVIAFWHGYLFTSKTIEWK